MNFFYLNKWGKIFKKRFKQKLNLWKKNFLTNPILV